MIYETCIAVAVAMVPELVRTDSTKSCPDRLTESQASLVGLVLALTQNQSGVDRFYLALSSSCYIVIV